MHDVKADYDGQKEYNPRQTEAFELYVYQDGGKKGKDQYDRGIHEDSYVFFNKYPQKLAIVGANYGTEKVEVVIRAGKGKFHAAFFANLNFGEGIDEGVVDWRGKEQKESDKPWQKKYYAVYFPRRVVTQTRCSLLFHCDISSLVKNSGVVSKIL